MLEQQVCRQLSAEVEINSCTGCLQMKHPEPSVLEQRALALTEPLGSAVQLEIYEKKMDGCNCVLGVSD